MARARRPRAAAYTLPDDDSAFPHASYGCDRTPDTYVEPFVAYRAWNWNKDGITSLNGKLWTPKQPFEAVCNRDRDIRSIRAAASTPEAEEFWKGVTHPVPDPKCTCGMYAGINMAHLIDIGYIQQGIHGEVSLWGRLYRHTLGWRAQFAYPKHFIIPWNMIPLRLHEAKKRLDTLTEFGVDIYIQPKEKACVGQENIPLWIAEYGYSQQGLQWLVEKRENWYAEHPKTPPVLKAGDRVAVMGSVNGIGIVRDISGGKAHYTMFAPNTIYSKPTDQISWNESNWRWETTGTGSVRGC